MLKRLLEFLKAPSFGFVLPLLSLKFGPRPKKKGCCGGCKK